jgi:hypothetical protein
MIHCKVTKQLLKFYSIFLVIVALQVLFWFKTHKIEPEMDILSRVPSKEAVQALSFGDEQFYFRILGLELQNAGDSFGRFTPLKDYDYKILKNWLLLLDSLDNKSDYMPAIASYYYSMTQRPSDNIYIIEYLLSHSRNNLEKNWWWMTQAIYLAQHKLKNKKIALDIAKEIAAVQSDKIPLWVKQFPAFIYADMGEKEQAYVIMKDIIDNHQNLTEQELNFMQFFIKDRIKTFFPVKDQ